MFMDDLLDLTINIPTYNTIIIDIIHHHHQTPSSQALIRTFDTLNLRQYIEFPTHVRGNTLDQVITPPEPKLIY